jgi:hypothetical protein
VVPAATAINNQVNPASVTLAAGGTTFYVLAASASITIQPQRGGAVGVANEFGIGQGQDVEAGFDTLIVQNFSTSPVVALIWVGFDKYINNQLILANSQLFPIAHPTYSAPNSKAQVNINDLSGTTFSDINGNQWGAIQRICILVFNTDSGVTLLLQESGSAIANGPAVGVIYPLTPIRFEFGGNYTLSTGGGMINAVVTEVYQAIPL